MKLLIIAVESPKVAREQIRLHLTGRHRQPVAAAEVIDIPPPEADGSTILTAAARAVDGLNEELARRRKAELENLRRD